jgi:FMN phosphatase YigB (HAD superfamily)
MRTIIFDWKQTLYDSSTKQLIEGARELLAYLKPQEVTLILIGKGSQDMYDEVDRLGVRAYFSTILFREPPKDTDQFMPFVDKHDPTQTIVIGDSIHSELEVGNKLHATTIRVKQGKFAHELPENQEQEPTYTVGSLHAAQQLLETLL